MSMFEILVLVLLFVFVAGWLYFAITDRRTAEKRFQEQVNFDQQLKDLSHKVFEFQTENLRLNGVIRDWIDKYNKIVFAYNDAQAELERLRKAEPENLEPDPATKEETPKRTSSRKKATKPTEETAEEKPVE